MCSTLSDYLFQHQLCDPHQVFVVLFIHAQMASEESLLVLVVDACIVHACGARHLHFAAFAQLDCLCIYAHTYAHTRTDTFTHALSLSHTHYTLDAWDAPTCGHLPQFADSRISLAYTCIYIYIMRYRTTMTGESGPIVSGRASLR